MGMERQGAVSSSPDVLPSWRLRLEMGGWCMVG
jgi:hypothetical protein